ncbi:MAG: YfiT family bacillithiol transferase [Acidobacteriota bacterium]
MTTELRYPIGGYEPPADISTDHTDVWIDEIEDLPNALRAAVTPLTDAQLDTPYRPDGWTVRQLVHHLPDSHINSYIRFKWALTEERPTIKAYFEDRWAELPDSHELPVRYSLDLLDALHQRWCFLLRNLTEDDLDREMVHPESGPIRLGANIGLYAWHGRHHLAHIERLIEREGW